MVECANLKVSVCCSNASASSQDNCRVHLPFDCFAGAAVALVVAAAAAADDAAVDGVGVDVDEDGDSVVDVPGASIPRL